MTHSDIYDFFLHRVETKSSIPADVWFTKDSCLLSHGKLWCGGGEWTLAMKINGAKENSLPSKNPLILLKLKKKRKKRKQKIES